MVVNESGGLMRDVQLVNDRLIKVLSILAKSGGFLH